MQRSQFVEKHLPLVDNCANVTPQERTGNTDKIHKLVTVRKVEILQCGSGGVNSVSGSEGFNNKQQLELMAELLFFGYIRLYIYVYVMHVQLLK